MSIDRLLRKLAVGERRVLSHAQPMEADTALVCALNLATLFLLFLIRAWIAVATEATWTGNVRDERTLPRKDDRNTTSVGAKDLVLMIIVDLFCKLGFAVISWAASGTLLDHFCYDAEKWCSGVVRRV
jgi:hypothetical protein